MLKSWIYKENICLLRKFVIVKGWMIVWEKNICYIYGIKKGQYFKYIKSYYKIKRKLLNMGKYYKEKV